MTTTALFVELLVAGLQSFIWLSVLALRWVSPEQVAAFFTQLSIAQSGVALAVAYGLGVVFDRVWDRLCEPVTRRIKQSIFGSAESLHEIRQQIFSGNQGRIDFIEYMRSRMRVSRALLCNSLATALAVILLRPGSDSGAMPQPVAVLGVVCGVLSVIAYYAFRDISRTYYLSLFRFRAGRNGGV